MSKPTEAQRKLLSFDGESTGNTATGNVFRGNLPGTTLCYA